MSQNPGDRIDGEPQIQAAILNRSSSSSDSSASSTDNSEVAAQFFLPLGNNGVINLDDIDDGALLRDMLNDSEFMLAMNDLDVVAIDNKSDNVNEVPDSSDVQCWVCFGTRDDDSQSKWVHPCRCRGTTKWVHQWCIQRWIDEKQKGNPTLQVQCPQCGTYYRIHYPQMSVFFKTLSSVEIFIQKICPIMTSTICIATIYWTCVSYGAVTVLQILGPRRGLALLDRTDPVITLLALPLLPVGLILARCIKWQDHVLRAIRMYGPKMPVVNHVLPSFAYDPAQDAESVASTPSTALTAGSDVTRYPAPYPVSDQMRVTRALCGAMALPTIAVSVGHALYDRTISSPLERVIAGGLTYLAIKGVVKIYYRQNVYVRQCKRYVANFFILPTQ